MIEPATLASAATWQPAMSTESETTAPAETTVPGPKNAVLDTCAGFDNASGEEDGGSNHLALNVALAFKQDPITSVDDDRHNDRPALVREIVEVGFEVGRWSPSVEPVAVIGACEQATIADHGGEGLPFDGDPTTLGNPAEH